MRFKEINTFHFVLVFVVVFIICRIASVGKTRATEQLDVFDVMLYLAVSRIEVNISYIIQFLIILGNFHSYEWKWTVYKPLLSSSCWWSDVQKKSREDF